MRTHVTCVGTRDIVRRHCQGLVPSMRAAGGDWGFRVPDQDPHDRRAGAGAVAAGDDAELVPVAYSMAFPARELTVDFQVGDEAATVSSTATGLLC